MQFLKDKFAVPGSRPAVESTETMKIPPNPLEVKGSTVFRLFSTL